jgi:hypothetical protein
MLSRHIGTLGACLFVLFTTSTVYAVAIPGQGTWESTMQGRDLDGNPATFEAYYDTTLGISWLADANALEHDRFFSNGGTGNTDWANAISWATTLNVNGVTGWRLPKMTPVNGGAFNAALSNNGTTDRGTATTTSDGTDGGWRDSSGNPTSELGHLIYVTLGNLGGCVVNGNGSTSSCIDQDVGIVNEANFSNITFQDYWIGTELNASQAFAIEFDSGFLFDEDKNNAGNFAWAVHDGDVGNVGAVPLPAAVWLFGSGLLGLAGLSRSKTF